MKKSLLVLLTLMIASSVFAGEFTGRILNLNQDEDGMKVVMELDKESNSPVLLYLDNKSKDFSKSIADLKAAKENADKVQITTMNGGLAQITQIKVLGK
jgi:hypothetical protein